MRVLVVSMVALSGVFVLAFWNDSRPNAEEIVQRPRAEVYARLNDLYGRVERQAAAHPTSTGRPPVPVEFAFEREEGEMLSLIATAGMREIRLTTWLEDGPAPGQTRVRVLFQPESMRQRAGGPTVLGAVETVLWRSQAQLIDGERVAALFGGIPERQHFEPGGRNAGARIDPSSGAPMVDVGRGGNR